MKTKTRITLLMLVAWLSLSSMTTLNTMVAEQLTDFKAEVDKQLEAGLPVKEAVMKTLKPIIARIIDTVCEYYQLSKEDITSTKRVAEIVLPRQVAMYMCRTLLSNPLEEIGSHLGGKDHTTVMSGVNKIKTKMETDASLRKNVENIKKQLVPENMI